MISPAGIPSADEALKTLIGRFRADPSEEACAALAAALLARGHATEALRVAEQGLEVAPKSVSGRLERAAALLALSRPRVAYVELRRVLALEPNNRRGLRLLGQAFKDAGAPERAAQLLSRRLSDEPDSDLEVTHVGKVPDSGGTDPMVSEDLSPVVDTSGSRLDTPTEATDRSIAPTLTGRQDTVRKLDLFKDLTKDLGLSESRDPRNVPPPRVEVTQVIRRKGLIRPPRSNSELAAIEGPIVDSTQPGHIVEVSGDLPKMGVAPREPMPMNETSATEVRAASLALDDEPQEHESFEVRPVESELGGEDHTEVERPENLPPMRSLRLDRPERQEHFDARSADRRDTVIDQRPDQLVAREITRPEPAPIFVGVAVGSERPRREIRESNLSALPPISTTSTAGLPMAASPMAASPMAASPMAAPPMAAPPMAAASVAAASVAASSTAAASMAASPVTGATLPGGTSPPPLPSAPSSAPTFVPVPAGSGTTSASTNGETEHRSRFPKEPISEPLLIVKRPASSWVKILVVAVASIIVMGYAALLFLSSEGSFSLWFQEAPRDEAFGIQTSASDVENVKNKNKNKEKDKEKEKEKERRQNQNHTEAKLKP